MKIDGNTTRIVRFNDGNDGPLQGKSTPRDGTPDVDSNGEPGDSNLDRIRSSLTLMVQQGSRQDVQIALMEVMHALGELVSKTEEDKIRFSQQEVQSRLDQKLEKLEQADKKLRRAASKDKGNKVWGAVKLAFKFATALATIAIATTLLVATSGTYAGGWGMLMTGGLQLFLAADALTEHLTGHGFGGHLALLKGGSKQDARIADLVLKVYVTAAIIVCAIATAMCDPVSSSSMAATKTMEMQGYVSMAQALVSLSTVAGDAYFATRQFQAAQLAQDSQHLRADGAVLEGTVAWLLDVIEECVGNIRDMMSKSSDMLASVIEMNTDTSKTLARTKYSV